MAQGDILAVGPNDEFRITSDGTVVIANGEDLTIGDDLSITGDLAVGGNAAITGALSITDQLGVTGSSAFTGVMSTGTVAAQGRITTTDGVSSGTARVVGGRASSNTAAGTSLTNSSTETVLGSYTIPASTLKSGSVLRACYKVKVTADNGATTLTVRLRLGATTLTGTVLIATGAVDTGNNHIACGFFELIARAAPGAAVALEGMGWFTEPGAAGGNFKSATLDATNFATNAALLLEVTGQWSAADGNACQLEHLTVDVI
jgi:hypothetical protein